MPVADIWLNQIEQKLGSELEQGDMPFLGLYSGLFDEKAREYFHEKVLGPTTPIKSYIDGLSRWPATFATYLTVHVVEGYGGSGTAEVYPFIEKALGTSAHALNQPKRVELWKAYRRACNRLGLSIVPEGSSARPFVDEYLRQAGVPIKYLADLTRKLESHAARLGLPSIEDPESVVAWQEQLQRFLGSPLSKTIPRAIQADETAYYTTTYLRVREFDAREESQNETECAIYDALQASGRKSYAKSAAIPELQWRNGSLGVQIPAGDASEWIISTTMDGDATGSNMTVVSEDERQFIPLPDGFPIAVKVTGSKVSFSFPAWEDNRDNRILIVDRSGRILARAKLGDEPVRLRPGSYTLVTRWEPDEQIVPSQISVDPAIFESEVSIASGQPLTLRRGPAELAIVGKAVAAMEWQGLSKTGVLGRELLAGANLSVAGTIPREIESAAPGLFELVLSARDIEKEASFPIELDTNQAFQVDLENTLAEWPFGLCRIGAMIRRRDIPNRPFARMSGLVWNGLASTDGIRFRCKSPEAFAASNIDKAGCENVRFDEEGLTYRENDQRYFRTVFKLPPNESVAFTWLVPGLFLSLVEINGENLEERPLAKESVIQVKPSTRSALKIYSTVKGVVRLGGFTRTVSESSISGMQVYLSPILQHLTADDRTLEFVGESDVPIPLVSIVAPHQFTKILPHRSADTYTVALEVLDEIAELSIEAIEVVSGRREVIELAVDVLDSATGRAMEKVWASSSGPGRGGAHAQRNVQINWTVGDWPVGAYVFHIRAKVGRRWGELVNMRGDVFVGSMVVASATGHPLDELDKRPTDELLDIFRRSTEVLLECYAKESWDDIQWIAKLWNDVAKGLDMTKLQVLVRTTVLALRRVPEYAPMSWAPIYCVASTRLDVFAQPRGVYRHLPSGKLKGLGLLRCLGEFGPSDQENFSRDDLFSLLVLFGFENGPIVASRAADGLAGFSLARFWQSAISTGEPERQRIRRREEWVPSPGLFLGARHYWWAIHRLEIKFVAGLAGNEHRRGNLLRLASRLAAVPWRDALPRSVSRLIKDKFSLGLLLQKSVEDETSQQEENISVLVALLSAVALACRYSARETNYLPGFLDNIAAAIDTDTDMFQMCLGYALYIGIDVFLYYLLLWEFVLSRDFDEVTDVV